MSSSLLLWLLFKPINLRCLLTTLSLSLNFHSRSFVRLQLVRNIGLFGGLGWGRLLEFLDLSFGIVGLDGRRFVGLQLLEVEVLDEIGWRRGRLVVGSG
jgi:hypothetical protein